MNICVIGLGGTLFDIFTGSFSLVTCGVLNIKSLPSVGKVFYEGVLLITFLVTHKTAQEIFSGNGARSGSVLGLLEKFFFLVIM